MAVSEPAVPSPDHLRRAAGIRAAAAVPTRAAADLRPGAVTPAAVHLRAVRRPTTIRAAVRHLLRRAAATPAAAPAIRADRAAAAATVAEVTVAEAIAVADIAAVATAAEAADAAADRDK